jgi:hypothetical protein
MNTHPRIRLTLEPLEDRLLLSASVQMTFATTTDSRTLSVNYTISGGDFISQGLTFNIYRSPNYNSLTGAEQIGTASLPAGDSADLSAGSHQGVKLTLTGQKPVQPPLTPDPARPFVLVAANPSAGISASTIASFETHVLGVIAHGLELNPLLWLTNSPPAWEMQMAASLLQRDGYEAVIPFAWSFASMLPLPGVIELAGSQLYQLVAAEADQLAAQHPGDVVDINFIGHSRGAVVISEVLQNLAGRNDPATQGGFMQMTLLDPHPSNPQLAAFSFNPALPPSVAFADVVVLLEALMNDPQVIVPPNVKAALEFDQQTPVGVPFPSLSELLLNLWGELPSALPNQSGQPIQSVNLTNVNTPGIGYIGHDEVQDWYLANVVNTNKTFTYFDFQIF